MTKETKIEEYKGSTLYDVYRDNLGYIHLCFIDPRGRGRELQFSTSDVLDAKDQWVNLDGVKWR